MTLRRGDQCRILYGKASLGKLSYQFLMQHMWRGLKTPGYVDSSDERSLCRPEYLCCPSIQVKFTDQIKQVLAKNGVQPDRIEYIVKTNGKRTTISRETTQTPASSSDTVSRLIPQPVGNLNPKYTFSNFIVGYNVASLIPLARQLRNILVLNTIRFSFMVALV